MKMKNNFIGNLLSIVILIAFSVTIFYFGKVIGDYKSFKVFDRKTKAYITDWLIMEKDEGKFYVKATYNYVVDKKRHRGSSLFNKPVFFNYYAALDGINKLAKNENFVNYSSKNVHVTKFDHDFSIKNLIYLTISFCVLIYFIGLKKNIKKNE